jgi:hypothetical protein
MKIDRIQCLVRMNYDGNPNLAQIPRSGPTAAYAFEIPLLRRLNDSGLDMDETLCCITEAEVVEQEDMTGDQIRLFLQARYKQPLIDAIYPGGRGYAKTLADCELDSSCLAKPKGNPDRKKAAEMVGAA